MKMKMIIKSTLLCRSTRALLLLALIISILLLSPSLAAKKDAAKNEKEGGGGDPLDAVNREIAALEARLSAIEHIKKYAESINLQELSGRDIEQTVAHFVKSTKKGTGSSPSLFDVSAERRANIQDKKNALDAMVGSGATGGKGKDV